MNTNRNRKADMTITQATKWIIEDFHEARRSIEMLVAGHVLTRTDTEQILKCYSAIESRLSQRVKRLERGRRSWLH